MLTGGEILKDTCTILQIILVIWQSKKICWMVYPDYKNNTLYFPSIVDELDYLWLVCKYQIQILIFKGILNFQINFLRSVGRWAINVLYIDWTVKWPFCVRDQKIVSLWSVNWTFAILATKLCQACKLLPTKDLRKATFNGFDQRTIATVALFFRTMLYMDGYWFLTGCYLAKHPPIFVYVPHL